jgi:hypothetical protein
LRLQFSGRAVTYLGLGQASTPGITWQVLSDNVETRARPGSRLHDSPQVIGEMLGELLLEEFWVVARVVVGVQIGDGIPVESELDQASEPAALEILDAGLIHVGRLDDKLARLGEFVGMCSSSQRGLVHQVGLQPCAEVAIEFDAFSVNDFAQHLLHGSIQENGLHVKRMSCFAGLSQHTATIYFTENLFTRRCVQKARQRYRTEPDGRKSRPEYRQAVYPSDVESYQLGKMSD